MLHIIIYMKYTTIVAYNIMQTIIHHTDPTELVICTPHIVKLLLKWPISKIGQNDIDMFSEPQWVSLPGGVFLL